MKSYFPYYFRKIGIVIVLISIAISMIAGINGFAKGYVRGYNWGQSHSSEVFPSIQNDNNINTPIHYKEILSKKVSNALTWIGITLSFAGFLMYIFAKEKTEDELIRKLRYMSLEKSLIITWAAAFIFLIFRNKVDLDAYSILQLQFFAYVFIYLYYKEKYEIR